MSGPEDDEPEVNFEPEDEPEVRIEKNSFQCTSSKPLPRLIGYSRESQSCVVHHVRFPLAYVWHNAR